MTPLCRAARVFPLRGEPLVPGGTPGTAAPNQWPALARLSPVAALGGVCAPVFVAGCSGLEARL